MYVPPDELLRENAVLREDYNLYVREATRATHADYDLRIVFPRKYLRGIGLEIGALHAPVPLPSGTRADYLDIVQQLRAAMPEIKITTDVIVRVPR